MPNIEAPWVGDYYDKYRNRYYQTGDEEMSDLWAYDSDRCDGDFCPMNCDNCPKADRDDEDDGEND